MRPRVQKVEEKVLKIDRPLAGGFSGLTGLWPEGCGLPPLAAMKYKVSVTELPSRPHRQNTELQAKNLGTRHI